MKQYILNIGDDQKYSKIRRAKNRVYNMFLFFCLIAVSLTLLTNVISWSWTPFDNLVYIGGFSILTVCFLLNYLRLHVWSVMTMSFASMSILCAMTLMSGDLFLSCIINLFLQSFIFAMIDSKKLIVLVLAIQLLVVLITIAIINSSLLDFGYLGYEPVQRSVLYSIVFILLAVTFGYLKSQIIAFTSENRKLIQQLKGKNEQLRQAYDDMERFSYVVSHDLKAPLRSINSFAQLITMNIKKENYEKVNESSKYIGQSAKKLSAMIDEILTYSKLNQNKSALKDHIALAPLVSEIKDELTQDERPFAIEYTDPLGKIYGNRMNIKMLLQNLIDNGIKYNKNSCPVIKIDAYQKEDAFVLEVKDNGIGIAPEDHSDAFALFKRLPTDKRYEGSGVGLANCKRIVENHLGGTISIQKNISEGTTFKIVMPAS